VSRALRVRAWRPASPGPPLAALIVLSALLFAAACGRDSGSTRVVNIVTAPPGGSWYVIGGTLASIINDAVPGVQAVAEVSGGAEENVRLVGTGQAILGFVISKTALQGYQGQAPFQQPFTNLRMVLSNLDIGRINVVVLEDSPLGTICDLRGRRVGVGPTGHGSLANLREIFSAGCGFSFDDITPVYLPYDQALSALGDGRLDAAVLYVSPPIPAISEFGATHQFRLLPLPETAREAVVAAFPYYLKTTIPAGAYAGVSADVPVVGTSNGLMVGAELPAEVVYQITKATFEQLERFRASYPTIAGFTLEAASTGGLIPYHDGAIRYYRERGVWPAPEAGAATR
jgi:TRAP transporter TAXI family solute receptor